MARIGLFTIIATAMISASPGAIAQYPSKPIRLIVPNPPGGAVDTLARLLGPALSKRLGQPLIVENRVGSNGNIAIELVARAPAGTAEPQVTRLRDEIAVVLNESETRERFANAGGMEPFATTPAELSALIRADHARYGAIVKAVGVKVD